MPLGTLVALAGGEGGGKTTAHDRLRQDFPEAVFVREPGATPVGSRIRDILLTKDLSPTAWAEFFLFMADRAQLAAEIVRPALEAGKLVISDRGLDGTFVYQCYTQLGIIEPVWYVNLLSRVGIPWPNLWLWFDLDPQVGIARRQKSGVTNRIDDQALAFHQKVREGYEVFMKYAATISSVVRLDANQTAENVYNQVKSSIAHSLTTK